jgi:hypothetical protein
MPPAPPVMKATLPLKRELAMEVLMACPLVFF